MSNTLILKARIRKRDKDIQQAIARLELEAGGELAEGEMADMVRDGFRKMLSEIGALETNKPPGPITADTARLVAKELIRNLREKS